MDPRKQECHGLYLYGAGYFSRDQNTLAVVSSHDADPPHFCLTCPRRESCEAEHDRRVRANHPAEVELFDRRMAEADRQGFRPTVIRLLLSQKGLEPFVRVAIENWSAGHGDRGRESGFLVHSDVDPRHH